MPCSIICALDEWVKLPAFQAGDTGSNPVCDIWDDSRHLPQSLSWWSSGLENRQPERVCRFESCLWRLVFWLSQFLRQPSVCFYGSNWKFDSLVCISLKSGIRSADLNIISSDSFLLLAAL